MVLPKAMRLKGYKCFDHIHKNGKRYKGNSMILKVTNNILINKKPLKRKDHSLQCAISISNKVCKKAVTRNRLRRMFHDHLRARFFENPIKIGKNWALLSLFPNCLDKNPTNLIKEFEQLLTEAGF